MHHPVISVTEYHGATVTAGTSTHFIWIHMLSINNLIHTESHKCLKQKSKSSIENNYSNVIKPNLSRGCKGVSKKSCNWKLPYIDGLMQKRLNWIPNALELCLFCIKPWIWYKHHDTLEEPLSIQLVCVVTYDKWVACLKKHHDLWINLRDWLMMRVILQSCILSQPQQWTEKFIIVPQEEHVSI